MSNFARISVVGLGYIGLPTAAAFASHGVEVLGVDVNPRIVNLIGQGKPHFGEPNLNALVRRVVESGKLRASSNVEASDAFLIAVPTPVRVEAGDHVPDLSFVHAATRAIAPVLEKGNLVVLESTCPPGTTEGISRMLGDIRDDLRFPHQDGELAEVQIAHCPERVLPGRILEEVVNNPRIVGGLTRRCAQQALSLYRIIVRGECRITDARTAELAKLAENAFRDVNIAFANELSVICDRLRINVWDLIDLANLHPRVNILRPGPGVGGHCIAVDPWFIVAASPKEAQLIRLARSINNAKPEYVCSQVREQAESLRSPVIACLGLSYKKDVDDLRESPAVEIVRRLADERLGTLLVVEPHISTLPPELADRGLELADFDQAVERANVILLLVDHMSFMQVSRDMLKDKIVIDTRGAW